MGACVLYIYICIQKWKRQAVRARHNVATVLPRRKFSWQSHLFSPWWCVCGGEFFQLSSIAFVPER
jgi:hypothetical protein